MGFRFQHQRGAALAEDAGHRLTQPGQPAPPAHPLGIEVRSVEIEDGTLSWHDGITGRGLTLGLKSLTASAEDAGAAIKLAAAGEFAGAGFKLSGETGSLARLQDPTATTPWPVKLALSSGDAQATVAGSTTRPLQGHGYTFKIDAKVPDLGQLQPFFTRAPLPPLKDLTFAATVADVGADLPEVTALTLHAGASDLSAYAAGLTLNSADIQAARMDQPVTVAADGGFAGAPLKVAATLGAPTALLTGDSFPVDVSVQAAGATAEVKGSFVDPAKQTGADLAITAKIPDLAAFAPLLGPVMGGPLPALKTIAFEAHLAEADGGFARGVVLKQSSLSIPQGDLAGDASVTFGAKPVVQATLTSKRIDVDALLDVPFVAAPLPGPAPQPGAPKPPPGPTPAAPRRNAGRLIPNDPLPIAALRDADADVTVKLALVHSGGETYRDITGHVVLKDGKLALDPLSGSLSAGRLSGRLTVDANPPNPPVALVLRAPGLGVRALAVMLGLPADATGAMEVEADLRGAGNSLQQIAAGLNGSLGLAMVNGEFDNRVLNDMLGPILTVAAIPRELLSRNGGRTPLRCFAARLDASGGIATVKALYLDLVRLRVAGTGTINLATEGLSLELQPLARVAEAGFTVPLKVGGTLEDPKVSVNAAGAAAANVAGLARQVGSVATAPLGIIAGVLGVPRPPGADGCASQLLIARGGREGPQPNTPESAISAVSTTTQDILSKPQELLRAPGNMLRNLFKN